MAHHAATPVSLLLLPPPFKVTRAKHTIFTATMDGFGVSELRRTTNPCSPPNQTHTPACAPPLGKAKSGCEGASRWARRPCPRPLHARIWHSFAQPICGPRPAMGSLGQRALCSPSTQGIAGPKPQKRPPPRTQVLTKASFCD